ncbi:putative mitochondrial 4-hydroxy-2-oxoglutarate aldolase [Drechslerella stenobrocha 248]|uniref:Putative mitochondrial 4-hydroxy-2-oxoglutarate aldolase n=1 Tax=Drechslerella stenobrocha 248 TaxID=1043628 RepID=W7HYL2_9PEZI|nr:putative mitochondrial 4-hydroxy-2-oxoglutarate aldolase [Drechslerella stenobrocha 248]
MSPTTNGHYSTNGHSNGYSNGHLRTHTDINGSAYTHRPLVPGVYVPTVCFFDEMSEDLDIPTIQKHAIRMAQAGVAGIATQGSNGEAVSLSREERKRVTAATREALDSARFQDMPIIVGCGAQSTRETIELCHDALYSGGDYVLILPPAYYKGLMSTTDIYEYFRDVAEESPLPVLIYNFPGAASGLDLDSDFISKLSQHHNIVGCKLTCGNSGKLARIAAASDAATPSDEGSGFMAMGGSADFTLQTLIAGGSGVIAGLANVAPKACVSIVNLYAAGKIKEAKRRQAIVARGDWAAIQGGLVGTKSCLQTFFNYGGYARKPLPKPRGEEALKWEIAFQEIVDLEESL